MRVKHKGTKFNLEYLVFIRHSYLKSSIFFVPQNNYSEIDFCAFVFDILRIQKK